jgi:hypothetical protein
MLKKLLIEQWVRLVLTLYSSITSSFKLPIFFPGTAAVANMY